MTASDFRPIPLEAIDVGHRLRPTDPDILDGLVADIAARGLRTPIEVVAGHDGRFGLIAGLYRLRACQVLEHETIMASIRPAGTEEELLRDEVMENLARAELTVLERCQFLARLKAIFVKETGARRGGDRRSAEAGADQSANLADWYKGVARRLDRSVRSVEREAAIGGLLSRSAADLLRGSTFEQVLGELDLLSRQPVNRQRRIAEMLTRGPEPRPTSVMEAVLRLGNSSSATAATKPDAFGKLLDVWNRATPEMRRNLIARCSNEDLEEAATRRGFRLVPVGES